jgi:hypothetical protein
VISGCPYLLLLLFIHWGYNESRGSKLLWFVTFAPAAITSTKKEGFQMFLILAVVLVLVWLGSFTVLHVTGFLIHLLLVFAVISLIMHFVTGKRAA